MANPFEKRATEYLRDDEAGFLSIVSPEPLRTYLEPYASQGQLYEKLVRIIGSPGSGKTTMATLVESRMVSAVLAEREKGDYGEIIAALDACGIVTKGVQTIAGVRLPMEGEYRDFWELPYEVALRTRLVLTLIQARAVLGLVRNLERREANPRFSFIIRSDAGAALESIGGSETERIVERARAVERAVYEVGASLVPPREEAIPEAAVRPFRPFDVIEGIRLERPNGTTETLRFLVILDDAHTLAPEQFDLVFRDLARREIRIARWIMMRQDGIKPEIALGNADTSLAPEVTPGRDYIDVFLNKAEDRQRSRTIFRTMARSMADRYLRRHPVFERRPWRGFSTLLSVEIPSLPIQTVKRIEQDVEKIEASLRITPGRREMLKKEIERYVSGAKTQDTGKEVQAVMLRILMHRYVNQVPQQSLFEGDLDPEPRRTMTADSDVANGARLYLKHHHSRALHYGMNALSDASSENAELFLHLAASLVDRMEARIINGDPPLLSPENQDKILGDRARQIIQKWNFPFASSIRKMTAAIAKECVDESLAPNAWLGSGANAIGIPQDEFSEAASGKNTEFTQILHYAVAYNAILLRPNYPQGNKLWCLLELGGPVILANSLTLNRGGFLQKRLADLHRYAGVAT
ncbi:MAG: hypothetical protein NT113_04265 [Hyphomicrobiales bacterium]|jgi:hypothetical protein|nr:hypothetical protein [Hyphomicrobiales bacterium]